LFVSWYLVKHKDKFNFTFCLLDRRRRCFIVSFVSSLDLGESSCDSEYLRAKIRTQ